MRLAELTVRQARAKIPTLIEALDGTFTDHHAFMCRHFLNQIDHLAGLVSKLDARIAELLRDRDQDLTNLDSIPGIGRTTAEIIISETGGNMAPFATAGHLASWIGVCPGVDESAGVNKSGHTRQGNANLKRILGTAAMAAIKQKDSYYAVYYRRITAAVAGNEPSSQSCTSSSPRSGTSWPTGSRTATWAPTTSPAATPNAPCARSSNKPTPRDWPSASTRSEPDARPNQPQPSPSTTPFIFVSVRNFRTRGYG